MTRVSSVFSHTICRILCALIIAICISPTSASSLRAPFERDDLLLQANGTLYDNTVRPFCYGGGMTANYFFLDQLSGQVVLAGGNGWFELSPGVIGVPMALLALHEFRSNNNMTFKKTLGTLFILVAGSLTSFENLAIHIPATEAFDIAPSLSFYRLRFRKNSQNNNWDTFVTANPGLTLNLKPSDHFTISAFGEVSIDYRDIYRTGVSGGIRIGGTIPVLSMKIKMPPKRDSRRISGATIN